MPENRCKVIVNKSTVPIGSGDWVKMLVLDGITESQPQLSLVGAGNHRQFNRPKVDFDVVSNPEFLREGSAIPLFYHSGQSVKFSRS